VAAWNPAAPPNLGGGSAAANPDLVSGGAAPSFEDIDLTDVSWTELDPDSTVKSHAFASGDNTVVMNALGSGSTDYAWTSGSNHRAPRWYKGLFDSDGNRLTSDDSFVLIVRIAKGAPSAEYATEVVVGVAEDPTSTTATTIKGVGHVLDYTDGGNPGYGAWTVNANTSTTNANNVRGECTVQVGGRRVIAAVYAAIKSDDTAQGANSRNANTTYTAATDLFIMVGVGTRGASTIAEDDEAVFSASYAVFRYTAE